jgi:hypothetical protein
MEITPDNVEKVLKDHGLGMDAGLNAHWLEYGFEPSQEKNYLTLEESFVLKPENIRTKEDTPIPVYPVRSVSFSTADARKQLGRLYGTSSYLSLLAYCAGLGLVFPDLKNGTFTFEQWIIVIEALEEMKKRHANVARPKVKRDAEGVATDKSAPFYSEAYESSDERRKAFEALAGRPQ